MSTYKLNHLFYLVICAAGICAISGATSPKTSRELLDYIRDARTQGLSDDQIRKNSLAAGWDQAMIEQTYSILSIQEKAPKGSAIQPPATLPRDYRIGAGDVLQIVVWKEPDASVPNVVVRADGKISIPLVKEVDAAGLTPTELEAVLTEKLGKLINSPDVTVVPRQITSRNVYLVGALKKPGSIALIRPMTVLQAITEAGGINEYAKRKKIYVLRTQGGKQIRLPFDYQAVLKGEHIEQNIPVLPDDTIVVPQ